MFGFGKKKADDEGISRLASLLQDYPAATPPFPLSNGASKQPNITVMTPEQALANLEWHKDAMPRRLALLANLLAEFGLDIDDAWSVRRREAMLAARDALLVKEFRRVANHQTTDADVWDSSDRAGTLIVHSLLHDLAMLDQEMFIRAIPGAYVGLNTDKRDREMTGYMRPTLKGIVNRRSPQVHFAFDHAEAWFSFFRLAAVGSSALQPFSLLGRRVIQDLDRAIRDPVAKAGQ